MAIQKEKQVRFLKQRSDLVIVQQAIESGSDLTIKKDAATFEGVEVIELGDNLELTENPDGSLKITAESGGLGGFEIEMTTGLYEYYANHNLDRYMHAGAITSTDGVVTAVGVKNVDELGDPSRNTCRIYSAEMMFGTLNVI